MSIKTGVLVHKKYKLEEPVFCKACLSRGQKKHFIIPHNINRDPSYYRLPYSTGKGQSPHRPYDNGNGGGGEQTEIDKLRKQNAILQKKLGEDKKAKTPEGDQPEEVEASLDTLQKALALTKQVGADITDLEKKIAAKKAATVKPPSIASISQKLKAAENHANQCHEAMEKQHKIYEASEEKAFKADFEHKALQVQWEKMVADAAAASQAAARPPAPEYNMAQQERWKQAIQAAETQTAAFLAQQKAMLEQTLEQLDATFKQDNSANGVEEMAVDPPIEGDTSGEILAPSAPAPFATPSADAETGPTPVAEQGIATADPDKENSPPPEPAAVAEARNEFRKTVNTRRTLCTSNRANTKNEIAPYCPSPSKKDENEEE